MNNRLLSGFIVCLVLITQSNHISATTIYSNDGSYVNIESGEMFLGDDYKQLGKSRLQEMFGDRLIVCDEDENGNVINLVVNGSGMIDATTGILNGSGNINLWFLGNFNLAEAEGQGEMERASMDVKSIPGAESIPGINNIKGVNSRTKVLNAQLKSLSQ